MKRLDLDAAKSKQKKNKMFSHASTSMPDVNHRSFFFFRRHEFARL